MQCLHADPQVNVSIPDIPVPENETDVEICISLNTGLTEQVIITVETGPKAPPSNQATGWLCYLHVHTLQALR